MQSISRLSSALLIASAIVLVGNVLKDGLTTVAAATMGFFGTSQPGTQTLLLYGLSGVLFVLGVILAACSILLEWKHKNDR